MRKFQFYPMIFFLALTMNCCSGKVSENQRMDAGVDAGSEPVLDDGGDNRVDGDLYSDGDVASDGDPGADGQMGDVDGGDDNTIEQATMFVDPYISVPECDNYDKSSRSCGQGNKRAFQSLDDAAAIAAAGDTVMLRGGSYTQQLSPSASGTRDEPLVFMAYPGERAVFSGQLRPAIVLSGLSYIIIQGLSIENTARWIYLDESDHCLVRDNEFLGATDEGAGSKSGFYMLHSTYNRIENNLIKDNPEDSMAMVDAERNVVVGNRMINAGHALWAIRCGDYNIIRGNYLYNDQEKIGEIYDCDGQSDIHDYDATKRNLVEGNEFAYVPSSGNHSPYSGIQYAGQDGIIRRNIFHSTTGPGLRMALYGQEARHNTGNRVYNNVFYGTDFAGLDMAEGETFFDNLFVNNVFAASTFVANDTRWDWWVNVLAGKPVQVKTSRLDGFELRNNCIFFDEQHMGDSWLVTYGWRSPGWDQQHEISWWEQNYPQLIKGTLEVSPGFEDVNNNDFHISTQSDLVDGGAFLTHVRQTASSKVIVVDDATWFFDGFEIPGEQGDTIRLAETNTRAVVTHVDQLAKTITLDRQVTVSSGQGITIDYMGDGPDVGAFETR